MGSFCIDIKYKFTIITKKQIMEKTIVIIHKDIHILECIIAMVRNFGYETKEFFYPGDFQLWKEKANIKDVKLIIIGDYFPNNGDDKLTSTSDIKGLDFYNNKLIALKKIKTIIAYSTIAAQKKFDEEYIKLKKGDMFINIFDLMNTLRMLLENKIT